MTTPHVTEMPRRLEPVQPDPFIEDIAPSSAARSRLTEREDRVPRVDLVRRFMRVRAGNDPGIRNGWPARATDRA